MEVECALIAQPSLKYSAFVCAFQALPKMVDLSLSVACWWLHQLIADKFAKGCFWQSCHFAPIVFEMMTFQVFILSHVHRKVPSHFGSKFPIWRLYPGQNIKFSSSSMPAAILVDSDEEFPAAMLQCYECADDADDDESQGSGWLPNSSGSDDDWEDDVEGPSGSESEKSMVDGAAFAQRACSRHSFVDCPHSGDPPQIHELDNVEYDCSDLEHLSCSNSEEDWVI